MHADYNTLHPQAKCSYSLYQKPLFNMNISFAKLGEEQCEECVLHDVHEKNHGADDNTKECDDCQKWKVHFEWAEMARKLYREDGAKDYDGSVSIRSVDLQKVIMLPRIPGLKTAIFTWRIIALRHPV
jgi:ssDNA-binding Zn-finger/Zn-ribbon topoisomerase 1